MGGEAEKNESRQVFQSYGRADQGDRTGHPRNQYPGVVAAEALLWHPLAEPLPDMAFAADRHILERYAATRLAGVPVDPRFVAIAK
jgi:hypothetical protein